MSRKNIVIALAALVFLAIGGLGYYLYHRSQGGTATAPQQEQASSPAQAPIATGQVPDPVFLVMDKAAVVRFSKAGQDIARQMQPVVQQAQRSLTARREALERDAAALQADTSVPAAERQKRIATLTARQNAIQQDADKRQAALQAALGAANGELSKAMQDIVPGIVKVRGANMVLDAAMLPQFDPALDITAEVIKQLDAKMTTVKMPLDGLK